MTRHGPSFGSAATSAALALTFAVADASSMSSPCPAPDLPPDAYEVTQVFVRERTVRYPDRIVHDAEFTEAPPRRVFALVLQTARRGERSSYDGQGEPARKELRGGTYYRTWTLDPGCRLLEGVAFIQNDQELIEPAPPSSAVASSPPPIGARSGPTEPRSTLATFSPTSGPHLPGGLNEVGEGGVPLWLLVLILPATGAALHIVNIRRAAGRTGVRVVGSAAAIDAWTDLPWRWPNPLQPTVTFADVLEGLGLGRSELSSEFFFNWSGAVLRGRSTDHIALNGRTLSDGTYALSAGDRLALPLRPVLEIVANDEDHDMEVDE